MRKETQPCGSGRPTQDGGTTPRDVAVRGFPGLRTRTEPGTRPGVVISRRLGIAGNEAVYADHSAESLSLSTGCARRRCQCGPRPRDLAGDAHGAQEGRERGLSRAGQCPPGTSRLRFSARVSRPSARARAGSSLHGSAPTTVSGLGEQTRADLSRVTPLGWPRSLSDLFP